MRSFPTPRVRKLPVASFDPGEQNPWMLYRVEAHGEDGWESVEDAIEASCHHQAIVRGCADPGIYRAQEHGDWEYLYFDVPAWGPPEPLRGE